jgi:type VI protein secretion system component VasF
MSEQDPATEKSRRLTAPIWFVVGVLLVMYVGGYFWLGTLVCRTTEARYDGC